MAINKLRQISILQNVPNYGQGYSDEPDYGSEEGYDPNYGYSDEPDYGMGEQPYIPAPEAPRAPTAAVDPSSRSARIFDMMNEAYTPRTKSMDRFDDLLDNMPERNDPGLGRRLVAAGMGVSGSIRKQPNTIQTMESVMYAPYLREMADFTAKATPFQQSAQLENTANINERTLAGNMITAQTQADRLAEQARQADQKNEVARVVAQARLATANRWTVKLVGERVIAYSPDGKESMDLGSSGNMTQQDKIELENTGRLAAAQAIGGAYYNTPGGVMRGNPRDPDEGFTPVPGAPRGPVTEVGGAGSGGNTAGASRVERNNRFRLLADERPDLAQKWLIPPISATGDWGIKAGPTGRDGWFWDTPVNQKELAEYNAVRKALGLSEMPVAQPQQAQPQPQQPVGNQPIGGSNRPPPVTTPVRPPDAPDPFMQGGGQVTDPFAQPSIQPGQDLGKPSEVIDKFRDTLRPQQPKTLRVVDPKTNRTGTIANTQEEIEKATRAGLRVEVGR